MSKAKILTEKIAEQFLKDQDSVGFSEFTSIEDKAAQALAQHKGVLYLSGLTSLSDAAAQALAQHNVDLYLSGLTSLSDAAAQALAQHKGVLVLHGLTSLSDAAAQALAQHNGDLYLGGLTSLSDAAAQALAQHEEYLYLGGLTSLDDSPEHVALAKKLAQHEEYLYREELVSLNLRGLTSLSDAAAQHLAQYNGCRVDLDEAFKRRLVALRTKQVQAKIKSGSLKTPAEWQNARIIPARKPAKPLKGRGAERANANDASWWLPKKVCSWFVQKLDDAHKTSVSGDGYGAGKSAYISPEAAELLQEKADAWLWLMESEAKGAKEKEAASLKSLATAKPPKQFKDGKVSLPKPKQSVAKAYCWKPDFEGDDYQSVLHYYSYLPAEHVGSITDPNGYPAKAMSPEAADLYRQHRAFWEAKHAESKAQAKTASKVRKQEAEQRVEKAAKTAGLSREELETKLDRLSELVTQGNLKLAADMIAGFGDPWLYEALLAGASITPEGDLKPGKVLKRFKEHAAFIMLLAVGYMPDDIDVDASINRNRSIRIEVEEENLELLAKQVLPHIPNLEPRSVSWCEVKNLSPETANFLSKCSGELSLSLTGLSDAAALALAGHKGSLKLTGFPTLTDVAAEAFSKHAGDLSLGVKELTEHQASLLAKHCGSLSLLDLKNSTAETITALAGHAGRCHIGLMSLSDPIARALALFQGDLMLSCTQLSPSAAKSLAQKSGPLFLVNLDSLDLEVARYLSKLSGPLLIGDEAHQCVASSEAIEALVKTLSGGDLHFEPCKLADTACEALAGFSGDVSFIEYIDGNITEMTEEGALWLAKRKSLGVQRTKIPKAARKIFESAGSWTDSTWTRKR